jgi:hypothetical protein
MPTKHTLLFRSQRAAATVMISPGEYSSSAMAARRGFRRAAAAIFGKIRRLSCEMLRRI